jgi:DNA-directed RNA polymerase specialized sigma24 family protein
MVSEARDRLTRPPHEVREAIRTLSPASQARLRRTARMLCRHGTLDAQDLLQEAFVRALDGTRRCPQTVDVVRFLAESMRSIASDSYKALVRERMRRDSGANQVAEATPDSQSNLETDVIASVEQECARIRASIVALFTDDPVGEMLVEGIMEEMDGEELKELVDLDSTGFASKRRLIRRRIDAAFPDGWK